MLVLPVFLTRLSSIKVRRENDCKGKTQILKIKKKKQYYQTLTIITKAFIRFQYILTCWHGSLIRNPLEVTSVFTLFVASLFSSLFQTLEAISCSCGISFSSVLVQSHYPICKSKRIKALESRIKESSEFSWQSSNY